MSKECRLKEFERIMNSMPWDLSYEERIIQKEIMKEINPFLASIFKRDVEKWLK